MLRLPEAEDLFAIALLQDMAVPLLAKELPSDYQKLFEARQGGANRLSDLEREHFGWTHAEAGAMMAKNWRLPETFATTIEQHANGDESKREIAQPGRRVVGLSALLPCTCDPNWSEREAFLTTFQRVAKSDPSQAEEFLAEVDREFTEFAPFLKLAQPAKLLTAYFQDEAVAV